MRLIDADDLKKDLRQYFSEGVLDGVSAKVTFNQILHDIDNAPTVITVDFGADGGDKTIYARPQGEWEHPYSTDIACECSNCHLQMPITDYFNFCPNCGADMRKGGAK